MTTVIPFIPSNIRAPKFNVTLDNANYTITVTWNVSAQRYYINVYGADGTWIITTPLVSCPPARAVNSTKWDSTRRVLIVQMVDPSFWPVPLASGALLTPFGSIVDYTLEGFQPDTYNGLFRGLQIDVASFSVPMDIDPGHVVVLGNVNRLMNMVQSVFQTSSLVYRNGAFEVNP
jgi:hypothetical protein